MVEAAGWMGGFSLRLPQGWQLNELQGIDSYVAEIVGDSVRLTLDFGWYSNSLVDDDDPQYIVSYEEVGGLRAKLVLPRGEGERLITGVYFEDFDGSDLDRSSPDYHIPSQNRLQISGVDLTPDQQETALAIFRTIRPQSSDSQGITDELHGDPEPIRSDGDIDPDDGGLEVEPGGGIGSGAGPPPADRSIRSDEDIDPNVCNLIHNINACTPEELEELGMAPITDSITVDESRPGTAVEGEPEPLYADGEPQYEVQSYEEAVKQDCGLAGGTVFLDSDGEVGCIYAHDLDDDGEGETQAQPPVVAPTPESLPAE